MKVNKTAVVVLAIWSFITIIRILNHIPWFDEARAWTIAEELSFLEIIKLMKVEGHLPIWYLLLMPFAKTHFHYPYPMQFLNWIFCLLALIVLWKKAPFPNFLKVFITFSFPFLAVYSVYARCYAIGILLLFLLTVLYRQKLERPILYSVLLVLCANTSVMALFGATAFGILFLYDFFRTKQKLRNLIVPIILFMVGVTFVLWSLLGADSTVLNYDKGIRLEYIANIFLVNLPFINLLLLGIFGGILGLCLFNTVPAFFVIAFTYTLMLYTSMFRWTGHFWNHYFFYIYLIVAIWLAILLDDEIKLKIKNVMLGVLSITSFLFIFNYYFAQDEFVELIFNSEDALFIKTVLNDEAFYNQNLIAGNNGFIGYGLLPYNYKYKFNLINYCDDIPYNFSAIGHPAENEICYSEDIPNQTRIKYYTTIFSPERIDEIYTGPSYLDGTILSDKLNKNFEVYYFESTKNKYKLEKYKCFNTSCIWYLERIKQK